MTLSFSVSRQVHHENATFTEARDKARVLGREYLDRPALVIPEEFGTQRLSRSETQQYRTFNHAVNSFVSKPITYYRKERAIAFALNPEKYDVFFTVMETRPTGELDSPRSTTSLRDAFTVRGRRERRPSQTGVRGALRPFPFAFEIPRSEQSGQELPPTFSSVATGECGPRGRAGVERSEVSYSVTALWEAVDGSDRLL